MARASYSSPNYDTVALARFRALCGDPTDDALCWIWTGGETGGGYGCFSYQGRNVLAHRWSYKHYRGPIPDGLTLDHVVCETPACVNPWHTEPRTSGENSLRGNSVAAINARATHCIHGHEFTKANTYTPPGRKKRMCRECLRIRDLRNRAKRTEKRRLAREARGWKPWA